MKRIIQKFVLTSSVLLSIFVPAQTAELLFLAPAAIGSYGTYKTLTEELGFWSTTFAQSCKKFRYAMARADSQHASMQIRTFLINFKKCFKPHEKMAIVGSCAALLIGVILTPDSIIGSLTNYYRYLNATGEEKDLYKNDLIAALKLLETGTLSLVIGAFSMMLLADYAQS